MRITADRDVCIGAGMCVLTAATVFDQDDEEGRVLLTGATPTGPDEAAAREAVTLCPSGALAIAED